MGRIVLSATLATKAQILFDIFMDAKLHSKVTGSKATVQQKVGGKFTAWDGYITGKIVDIVPAKRIVQSWRTKDFTPADSDSQLTIEFNALAPRKVRLKLTHTNLPAGSEEGYRKGWKDFYIEPIKEYVSGLKKK
jgi:activator of HSP90 ATPase